MADLSITNTHARNIKTAPTAENLLATNLDIWTTAIEQKSSAGRGSSKKFSLYGIKKLRELILELAVRGKLVPQDANDEPASVLLERIAAEKLRLLEEEKLRTNANEHFSDKDLYLIAPDSWGHCRLGNLAKFIDYRGKTPNKLDAGIRLITAKNVKFGFISLEPEEFISEEEYETWMTRGLPRMGDILFTPEAPLGNVAIINVSEKFALAQRAICFQMHEPAIAEFVKIVIMSQAFQKQLIANATGMTAAGIKASKLKEILVPVPPLEEQHRIVAKVDELMLLCDALETQTEASIAAHQTLVETLLNALLLPQTAANTASQSDVSLEPQLKSRTQHVEPSTERSVANSLELSFTNSFVKDWQRVAEHFDTLFTTSASIDTLKQTILQLAVMGKLVKQDPNDEPAAKLLERIAKEKALLIADKKIKKQKPLPAITDEEKPFELPNGWEWCRVNDLLYLKNGYAFKSKYFNLDSGAYILATPGNFYETGGFRHRGSKTKYYDGPVQEEFLLTEGDLIIPLTEQAPGLLGSAAFIPNDGNQYLHNQRLGKLTPYSESLSPAFVSLFFNSAFLRRELARTCTGTTVRHTSPDRVLQNLMPMLPLEEQVRIVAKVDELMALCDQLKARLADAQTTQLHLTDAIVEKAI